MFLVLSESPQHMVPGIFKLEVGAFTIIGLAYTAARGNRLESPYDPTYERVYTTISRVIRSHASGGMD